MKLARPLLIAATALTLFITACSTPNELSAPDLEPQFGTALDDEANVVAADPAHSSVYVAGVDQADPGAPFEQGGTVFLRRYTTAGNLVWKKQLAELPYDAQFAGLGVDRTGNVYLAWSKDSTDGYGGGVVSKFSAAGKELFRVAVDNGVRDFEVDAAGNTYLAGERQCDGPIDRAFLRKYSSSGQLVWNRANKYVDCYQRDEDIVSIPRPLELGLAGDGSVYTLGTTTAGFVLSKYDNAGRSLWSKPLAGTKLDTGVALTAGAKDAYLVGYAPTSSYDTIVTQRYSASGSLVWERTLKPSVFTSISEIDADSSGNVFLAGTTSFSSSDSDFFLRKYTATGSSSWVYTARLETTKQYSQGVSASDAQNLYFVGSSSGEVNGQNYGYDDAFLLRLNAQGQKIWSR